MASKVPAIIIAAGESKRLGRPKAFVEVAGKTLLQHALEKIMISKCDPIVVVTNQDNLFRATTLSKNATVALNSNPELGRTGSIQVGLKAIIIIKPKSTTNAGRPVGLIFELLEEP